MALYDANRIIPTAPLEVGLMRLGGTQFDVAVVGASLAGCSAATLFGRAGLRVALIDKHAGGDAYKRLCGHYVQASATPVLERLGLAGPIEAAGGVRNGADVWTRWGLIASPEPPGERPYGYSIRRAKLDPMARRVACGTPGVEYLPAREAVALLGGRDDVCGVELRDRAGRRMRLGARLVVGADGRLDDRAAGGRTGAARCASRSRRSPRRRISARRSSPARCSDTPTTGSSAAIRRRCPGSRSPATRR
jgi:flavin-dependent dehydrogenase